MRHETLLLSASFIPLSSAVNYIYHCQSTICLWLPMILMMFKGFAKLKKFQKSKKTWMELTPPTHPPSKLFCFGNPSLAWTEHSNHNNQQHLAVYIQTEYTWYTTPKYQYWFRAILGRFSKQKNTSETWTHPPTSTVISDFWNFFSLQSPLAQLLCPHLLIQLGTTLTFIKPVYVISIIFHQGCLYQCR